jgi:hypothetical protein
MLVGSAFRTSAARSLGSRRAHLSIDEAASCRQPRERVVVDGPTLAVGCVDDVVALAAPQQRCNGPTTDGGVRAWRCSNTRRLGLTTRSGAITAAASAPPARSARSAVCVGVRVEVGAVQQDVLDVTAREAERRQRTGRGLS